MKVSFCKNYWGIFRESLAKVLLKPWRKTTFIWRLGGLNLLCQNWPMKVSKDQHLKAERKCLSAAAAEWSVTRDQTPGTIWGYHTSTFFLKIFANMYRERKTWSSRKFGERIFFFGEDDVFQMKEFRTTLIYFPFGMVNGYSTSYKDYFPFGKMTFQGKTVKLWVASILRCWCPYGNSDGCTANAHFATEAWIA